MKKETTIAVLGAGSWGTAFAIHLAHYNKAVLLWGHHLQTMLEMGKTRFNQHYLPEHPFPESLYPVSDLNYCLAHAQDIILAVPSHAFASVLSKINIKPPGLCWLTKGIDPKTNKLLSELVYSRWGKTFPVAIISGPSFAKEVAEFLPTALTLASNNQIYQQTIQALVHHHNMRVYLSTDIIGVQLCGAVKNVLAIACGMSDGLGFGANARAALITRGLAEMRRLGLQMGAQEDTFSGLAGLGDLVLTCTDNQSRNRRFGFYLGQDLNSLDAEKKIHQVVEGKHNAAHIALLAAQWGVDMPICAQVKAVLSEEITARQAALNLMNRLPKQE